MYPLLQFDVDGDGLLDLMFTTSSGELLFYSMEGRKILDKRYHVSIMFIIICFALD